MNESLFEDEIIPAISTLITFPLYYAKQAILIYVEIKTKTAASGKTLQK